MKRLFKALLAFLAVGAALTAAGAIAARRMERGTPDEDDFVVAAIFGGREFSSRAKPLATGRAVAVLGGIELDLSEATCGPEGVRLALHATLGGIHLTVPEGWTIEVDDQITSGAVELKESEHANGSGSIHVTATGHAGGVMIESAG